MGSFGGEPTAGCDECRRLPGLELDLELAEGVWDEAMRLPGIAEAGPDAWCHGDLVAENLLVDGVGRLAALLDFGALSIALLTFPYYWESMPERCANRLVMARAVLEDACG